MDDELSDDDREWLAEAAAELECLADLLDADERREASRQARDELDRGGPDERRRN